MTVTEIGLNTSIQNITAPNITFPTSASEVMTQMTQTANTETNFLIAPLILYTLLIIVYLALSDKTQFSEFKYTDIRAIVLAFGIVSIFAISLFEIGFIANLMALSQFIIFYLLTYVILLGVEHKE
jgi:hypothetical protein